MAELIHQLSSPLVTQDGMVLLAQVWGEARDDGTWEGWLEFLSERSAAVLRTGRETTQSNRAGVAYWATGLEPVYLEGALSRATRAPAGFPTR